MIDILRNRTYAGCFLSIGRGLANRRPPALLFSRQGEQTMSNSKLSDEIDTILSLHKAGMTRKEIGELLARSVNLPTRKVEFAMLCIAA